MLASYFQRLNDYNLWANSIILDAAAGVDPADYHAEAPGLSFGSLHATLVHEAIAETIWVARFRHVAPPPHLSNPRYTRLTAERDVPTLAAVRTLFAEQGELQRAYFAALTDADFEQPFSYATSGNEPWTQPLDEVMGHLFNHSTQFRSEAAVRLSALDHSPGDLDYLIFLRQH